MSRHGYSEIDSLERQREANLWQGAIRSAFNGKRGQAFLHDALEALDSLPAKRLIDKELLTTDGDVCLLGSVGLARNIDMSNPNLVDYPEQLSELFNLSEAMIRELEYQNDEGAYHETPEQRFTRMRQYIVNHIK